MSKCAHCLQGLCKRHPLQDHGEREAFLKSKVQSSSAQTSIQSLIQAQIEKLQSQARGSSVDETAEFRNQLDAERQQLQKQSKSSSKHGDSALANSGLDPSVAKLMRSNYDSDADSDSSSDDSNSKSKSKKRKRKEEKKHKKDKKKSKKHKKDKKKRKRSDSDKSSDSDDSSKSSR